MATHHRNRLVKVHLFEAVHLNLLGSIIVGQNGDTIIIERPQPKPRSADAKPRKRKAAKTNAGHMVGAESVPAQVS